MPNEGTQDSIIRFNCPFCGRQIYIPRTYAGKKGKCPQCKNVVVIPQLPLSPPPPQDDEPIRLIRDYELPSEQPSRPMHSSPQQWHRTGPEPVAHLAIQSPDRHPEYTLADLLSYPISISGGIHLVIFFVLGLQMRQALNEAYWMAPPIGHIALLVIAGGYCLYYLASCIRTSAAGELRAPDINLQPEELNTDAILSRLFTTTVWAVFCVGPLLLYFILTRQTNFIFWLLVAYAIGYSPMAFLAIVLFDSLRALNPLLVIPSILNVFVPYVFLVLGLGLVCAVIVLVYRWSPFAGSACSYLIMLMAHVLGRFHRRYKSSLNWEV
jgi:hypothetical protein